MIQLNQKDQDLIISGIELQKTDTERGRLDQLRVKLETQAQEMQ